MTVPAERAKAVFVEAIELAGQAGGVLHAPQHQRRNVHAQRRRDGRFCDTGKGITPAEAPHIFEPFYCGRQAGRGLGLGLPRAARIVAMAQGRIDWSTNPGHGTLFQVFLPIPSPPEPIHQSMAAVPDSASTSASTPSHHLLGRQAPARKGA